MSGRAFSIAFVCSGNRFRSPLACVFVKRLTLGLPVEVVTAGTLEIDGARALPEAREIATLCGLDLADHRARPLSRLSLKGTHLVIGFEEEHVRRAIVDAGAELANSFTFREFSRLLRGTGLSVGAKSVDRAREVVALAAERRSAGPRVRGGLDDVPDPFGRGWKVYRDTAVEIRELSLQLAEELFGVTDTRTLPTVPERIGLWRPRFRRFRGRRSIR